MSKMMNKSSGRSDNSKSNDNNDDNKEEPKEFKTRMISPKSGREEKIKKERIPTKRMISHRAGRKEKDEKKPKEIVKHQTRMISPKSGRKEKEKKEEKEIDELKPEILPTRMISHSSGREEPKLTTIARPRMIAHNSGRISPKIEDQPLKRMLCYESGREELKLIVPESNSEDSIEEIKKPADEELQTKMLESLSGREKPIRRKMIAHGSGRTKPNDNSLSLTEKISNLFLGDKTDHHPGVICDGCDKPINSIRFKCVFCKDFDFCDKCENDSKKLENHFNGKHTFAKIRDSNKIDFSNWPIQN